MPSVAWRSGAYTVGESLRSSDGTAAGEAITLVTSLLDAGRHPVVDFPGLCAARGEAGILFGAVEVELVLQLHFRFVMIPVLLVCGSDTAEPVFGGRA